MPCFVPLQRANSPETKFSFSVTEWNVLLSLTDPQSHLKVFLLFFSEMTRCLRTGETTSLLSLRGCLRSVNNDGNTSGRQLEKQFSSPARGLMRTVVMRDV